MSTALRKLIRELVEEELELDETSSSGAAGPYNTPFAFRGDSAAGKAKAKKIASQAGYEPVDKKAEKADPMGNQEVETVPFGEKGAGALKKPAKEKVVQEETRSPASSHQEPVKCPNCGAKYKDTHVCPKTKQVMTRAKGRPLASKKNQGVDYSTRTPKKEVADAVVSENRYTDYKMSEGSPSKKIGTAIREINRQINEVDRMLRMNERLKKESGVQGDQLWKSTARGLTKLEGRLNTLSTRIRNLKS